MAKRKKRNHRRRIYVSIFSLLIVLIFLIVRYRPFKRELQLSEEFSGIRTLNSPFVSHGIDISHHQSKIDWELFKKKGADTLLSFVYCKATEGNNFVDPLWKINSAHLSENSIQKGAYHFFHPTISAKEQAVHFLTNYSPEQSDLPPAIDSELETAQYSSLIDSMHVWLNYVEKQTGKRPIIYTSYFLYSNHFQNAFPGYKFWIANYNDVPKKLESENIIHWQYSDKGKIPGIRGNVDLNVSKIEF